MTGGVDASSLETSRQKIAAAARGLVALSAGGPSALTARVDDVGRYVDALGAEARRLSFAGLRRATDALSDAVSSWRHAGGAPERAPTALARVAELLLSGANEAPERWDAWSLETRAELIALLGAVALGVSAAGGAPTSAARKAPSGAPPPDADLIDLFLSELESGMPRLLELVLALEDDGASISAREEAMRLVHSLKGAARIVGLLSVVTVLHAAEDMLSPATRAHALSSADAGNLLRLVDLLAALSGLSGARVAVWVTQHQAELSELGDALRRPATAGPAASAALAPASPIGSHTGAATGVGPTQADPRALRVNADVLSRLLGLAGETVVEARRLSSWPRSNVGLERLHGRLASRADEILRRAAALGDGGLVSVAEGLIAEVGEASRLFHESRHATSDGLQRLLDAGERLYLESLRARQRPFAQLVPALRRQVRDSAKALGKIAKLEIHGAAIPVDGDVLTSLEPMLTHLVTNALDHGIEPEALRTANGKAPHGTLRIDLKHVRGQLALTVGDDGAGIDPERVRAKVIEGRHVDELTARALDESELFEFLFLPAFSTASAVSVHSGRGVGLDAVRTEVTRLGGRIALHSQRGKGTRFELTLPLTRVVVRALLVQVSGEAYALPLARAGRVVRVPLSEVHSSEGRDYVELDGENVGVVRADDLLEVGPAAPSTGDLTLVLLGEEGTRYGLAVDRALGEDDLVVRPLDPRLGRVPDVAATALLADGSPTIVLDADELLRSIEKLSRTRRPVLQRAPSPQGIASTSSKRVLVVDDSVTVREVERQLLQRKGYEVDVAVDGVEAWSMLKSRRYDLVITDVDMPRMNGLELVRAIRADVLIERLPVIIVSYKERDEDRIRGLEVGADQYLTKSSFHDDQLTNAVHGLIGEA